MSINAIAIMLKPFLSKYLEPLEENGSIAKLQADIELIAKSNAIPELASLVSELRRHNELLERLAAKELIYGNDLPDFGRNPFSGSGSATAGHDGNDGIRMSGISGTD